MIIPIKKKVMAVKKGCRIEFRVSEKMKARFDKAAEAAGIDLAELIRRAVCAAIEEDL